MFIGNETLIDVCKSQRSNGGSHKGEGQRHRGVEKMLVGIHQTIHR